MSAPTNLVEFVRFTVVAKFLKRRGPTLRQSGKRGRNSSHMPHHHVFWQKISCSERINEPIFALEGSYKAASLLILLRRLAASAAALLTMQRRLSPYVIEPDVESPCDPYRLLTAVTIHAKIEEAAN